MELPVRVTILGDKPVSFNTAVVTLQPRQLSLSTSAPLPLRAPLKIETAEHLWLGEVVEVNADGAKWLAAVRIDHALADLNDLARLAHRFAGNIDRVAVP